MSRDRNAPRLRALIYNRVSADPSGSRISVDSQDHENRTFCERQGWEIVGTITDDDRSASRFAAKEREGYREVLAALDGSRFGRVDVLVTWESSRGERRLDGYVRLRDRLEANDVLLAYKGRVFNMAEGDDRFMTGLDALLDEREAERARERTLRSHRDSVRRGTPRGVTPYGYQREYDPHSGRLIAQIPNPETAPVVRELVARILGGDTLYSIARDLNRREVPTPRGYRNLVAGRENDRPGWTSSIIRNLLSKQSLMGVRTHHGAAVGDATWEPIVSPSDWAAVQRALADPLRRRNERGVKVQHLLSGIAECGVCGAWLRPLRNNGRMTYVCAGGVPTAGKGHVSRSRVALDGAVTIAVIERASQPDFLQALARRGAEEDGDALAAQREMADIEAKMARYVAAAKEKRGLAFEAFSQLIDELQVQYEDAERRARPRTVHPAVLDFVGPDAAARWAEMPLERQRQVVRAMLRIRVHRVNGARGARAFDPSSVELIWH